MIDFDEIRKQVAIKHNVLLGKDDPIFITITINELILGRYLEMATKQSIEAHQTLSDSLQQQVSQSKEIGGRIITDASNYVSDQLRKAVQEAGVELRNQIRSELTNDLESVASHQTDHQRFFWITVMTCLTAIISVAAMVIMR